jgi:hypothetical protein
MGTPSKIGNEYNVVINGTADWENTFVKFINFSAAGPSGTTTVQSAASLLNNFNSTITSINSLLKSGSYVNGVLTFNTSLRTIKVYGPIDYSGNVVANKIEIIINDPAVGSLQKTTLTGRVEINPISFKIGNGDSISNITLTYASNADGVSRVGSIDTALTYDSKDQLNGKINNYTSTTIENEGDLKGYAYQSKFSFTGVDVAASVVDRLTYWSDEKIFFDYIKGYDSKGVVIYSRTITPAKGLPLETDSGLFTTTLLNGNSYVVVNGSSSAPVSSYGGDDYISDNSSGENKINGGDGTDIVEYQDSSTKYTAVKITDTSFQLIKNNIVKTLTNIEQIKFLDKTVLVNTLFLVSSNVNISGVPIKAANNIPAGSVTIAGKLQQNETLYASSGISDADGLGPITYYWRVSSDGKAWADLSTGSSLTLSESLVGKYIFAYASYVDGNGNAETVSSTATTAVLNVNDSPAGTLLISGTSKLGQVLSVTDTISDADGLGLISYVWQSSGDGVTWANVGTGSTVTLASPLLGKYIRAIANYTDARGTPESVSSSKTETVKSFSQLVTNENHKLTVIVDKGILGSEAMFLKGLSESITLTDGIETKHTVQYGNSVFDYSQIDALITIVTRDDEFTKEFTKEINDYLKTDANITYKVAVGLVGAASIDAILMTVAGSDGNYVG